MQRCAWGLAGLLAATAAAAGVAGPGPLGLSVRPAMSAVAVDGRITDDEWQDAALHVLEPHSAMLAKASLTHVYLAWRADQPSRPFDVELYIEGADGTVRQMHVADRLGERRYRADRPGALPPLDMTPPGDWLARSGRRTPSGAEDGVELMFERAMMVEPLRIRFELHDPEGLVAPLVHPPDAGGRSAWLPLALPPLADGRTFAVPSD